MTESSANERSFSQLVVVGASAGGIEALSAMVSSLPENFPAPVVVAQHLSPHRASALAEILARRSPIPVRTVNDREHLNPGVIYVVPPNRDVMITDHEVSVIADSDAGPRPSVDLLFRSAARIFGEDLIAVVLSGSGSDGAAGAREVKQAGGTVVVQNPESAPFPGMPLSLPPSIVDIVANPDRIGSLLSELLNGSYTVASPTDDNQLRVFLDQLREESGIDFNTYKPQTIQRRLQRRMVATSQTSLQDYVRLIRRSPEERQRLIASFLIKVTEFFRDPELFTYLREHVLPELVAEARHRGTELRLWSAGCATGEEAYSLAMLVAELIGDDEDRLPTRIFATDLDATAVGFARLGVYPARALENVPPAMIERYFTEHNGEYEVKKPLRSLLVFGEHDLGQRAPFPRIDLILCRNVLIYFTSALQRRALQLFAFSLRPGGYIGLGKSESVNPLAEYFAVDQPRLKVFRRAGDRALIPPTQIKEPLSMVPQRVLPARLGLTVATTRASRSSRDQLRSRSIGRAEQVLLALPIGVVLVDRDYDIHSINAAARRMFGIHTSAIDRDFIHLVQYFSSGDLRRQIDRAFTGVTTEPMTLRTSAAPNEALSALDVVTSPVATDSDDDAEMLVAITATDVTGREQIQRVNERLDESMRRIATANDEVLSANAELTGTIAKLRVENEELLVAAEEVQSATEEVETLNEELQASNEELETLNEELQATIEELNTTNDDLNARTVELQEAVVASDAARSSLQSVLSSIADAVAVVNGSGTVVLKNAAYDEIESIIGDRPLGDDDGDPLDLNMKPVVRAARHEAFSMTFSVTFDDGSRRWFEADGRPIPRIMDILDVVTVRDVTERSLRHLQDQWMGIASHELRTPLTALQVHLQMAARVLTQDDGQVRRHVERASIQVARMERLISQLIDVTRFQQGRLFLETAPVELKQVVLRAVETVELIAPAKKISVHEESEDLVVIGDEIRLEQVLLNLMLNAVHHAPDSKRIDIDLKRIDDDIQLSVHDDGPGMSPSLQATIFDRYSQVEGSRGPGLGLGLFIARVLVTEHGGTIRVESAPGEGTTFIVRLPSADSPSVLS